MLTADLSFIRVAQPYLGDLETVLADLRTVLSTGRLMEGPFLHRFEEAFRERIGTRQAVAVNSCTTALEIILRHMNLQGKEVIVPTNSFIAAANAVLYAGGKPVFADISPDTFCLSPEGLLHAITGNSRAVLLVHIAGLITPDLEEVQEICRRHRLALIEDCAHAHGATRQGRSAGALGAAGAFSFHPTKIITTGTGGMITTDDDRLAEFARSVRMHGRGESASQFIHLGNDWFMDEISAAIGYHQWVRLDEILEHRNQVVKRYRELLEGFSSLTFPEVPLGTRHSYYKIPVLVKSGVDAVLLKERCLKKHGLELESLYYPPCHLQPVYRRMFRFREGLFPVAEEALKRQICLPVHRGIQEPEIFAVAQVLREEILQVDDG